MASPDAVPAAPPNAHVVGNMFVEQYYPILHHKPEDVHKFYHDSSILSRPDINGDMTSVTTMQAIDEKVRSLDHKSYKVVIETVDAQHSYKDGVLVLVTGSLTGKDRMRQKFTQSFFLAPQDNRGYFVLNDVFRYVSDSEHIEFDNTPVSGFNDTAPDASLPESEPIALQAQQESDQVNLLPREEHQCIQKDSQYLKEDEQLAVKAIDAPVHSSQDSSASDMNCTDPHEDVPKKSYASIVKVATGNTSSSISTLNYKARIAGVNVEKLSLGTTTPSPLENSTFDIKIAPVNIDTPDEGHSIYIRNLPYNATAAQLEEEFKRFGAIKHNGVQVRNHKQHGHCFGFVEFESLNSMQAAIEASPVTIGGRHAVVEEKRTTTRVNGVNSTSTANGRGRFSSQRGGFRNDSFQVRGGFGGQNYSRNDFRNRGEIANRGRDRGSEGYQRVGRAGMMTAVSA